MKGLALTLTAFALLLFSTTTQAQTVYHIDRILGPGTVKGTITVDDNAIPGPIGREDIISWSFETNDGLSDPPPAHGPIIISSAGIGGMEGNAWPYLSATESELLFDFEGAFNDPNVYGIGFNDALVTGPVTVIGQVELEAGTKLAALDFQLPRTFTRSVRLLLEATRCEKAASPVTIEIDDLAILEWQTPWFSSGAANPRASETQATHVQFRTRLHRSAKPTLTNR